MPHMLHRAYMLPESCRRDGGRGYERDRRRVPATQRMVVGANEPRMAQPATTTAMDPRSSAMVVPSHSPRAAQAAAITAIRSTVRRAVTPTSCH
jgi:hypothetical protein